MMGKNKQKVTFYRMSQYWSLCDTFNTTCTIKEVQISGKNAWSGSINSADGVQTVYLDSPRLFSSTEQGVQGYITFLPGNSGQSIPVGMANMMGYNLNDCPGYFNQLTMMMSDGPYSQGFSWGTSSQMRTFKVRVAVTPICPGLTQEYANVGYSDNFSKVGDVIYYNGDSYNLTEGSQLQIGENTCTISGTSTTWNGTTITLDDYNNVFSVGEDTLDTTSNIHFWRDLRDVNNSGNSQSFTLGDFRIEVIGYHTLNGNISGNKSNIYDYNVYIVSEGEVNPAWIAFDTITYPYYNYDKENNAVDLSTIIDIASFDACAQTLYNEGIGMSLVRYEQGSDSDFLDEIKKTVNCAFYTDMETGLWRMKLIRADYDVTTMSPLTKDNIISITHTRKSLSDLCTTLNVEYTNSQNMGTETVTVTNNALNMSRTRTTPTTNSYKGITNLQTAFKLARRDIQANSYPFAGIQLYVLNNSFQDYIYPGDVFLINYVDDGIVINNVVFRVITVDYGSFEQGYIQITASEDVFTLPSSYLSASSSNSGGTQTVLQPAYPDIVRIFTAPYYFIIENGIDISQAKQGDAMSIVLATPPNKDCSKIELYTNTVDQQGNYSYQFDDEIYFSGHATLKADLNAEITSSNIMLANFTGNVLPSSNYFLIIDNSDNKESFQEIALITSVNSDGSINLERGTLDTVPRFYPAGTSVWIYNVDGIYIDETSRSEAETVSYKMMVTNRNGVSQTIDQSETVSATLTNRFSMPVVPKNVAINGTQVIGTTKIDCSGSATATITFARRNKTLESTQVILYSDADYTPENGQTTSVDIIDLEGNILKTYSNITGTSMTITAGDFSTSDSSVLVNVYSVLDNIESLQKVAFYIVPPVAPTTTNANSSNSTT